MRPGLLLLSLALFTTAALADDSQFTLTAEGKPALQLTLPEGAKAVAKGLKTTIQTKTTLRMYFWEVPGPKTVAEAVPNVGQIIKSEFLEYVVESTASLQVAGHEAKHLMGKGEEADDNDPGTADVVIFTDGSHVFAACVHGEGKDAAEERPELLKVLQSAKRP